jgi:hypothetical protein
LGTGYGDTVAPIEAVLNVRSDLGNQAVTRACDYLKQQPGAASQQQPCDEDKFDRDKNKPWKMKVIKLQDEAYGLALGWNIFQSSFDIVSRFVGHDDFCDKVNDPPNNQKADKDWQTALYTAHAIANNSCVLQDMEAALKPAH